MIKRIFTRANRRTENDPDSKPSPYRGLVFLGVAGFIMLVLGFIIGWVWLVWLGFALIFAAAFTFRLWFIGNWIPTLFTEKERDQEDSWRLPPPPTV